MGTIVLIVLGIGIVAGVVTLISSREADPAERAKEAAAAAAGGAMASLGCIFQLIVSVIPLILGLFFLGLLMRSCS